MTTGTEKGELPEKVVGGTSESATPLPADPPLPSFAAEPTAQKEKNDVSDLKMIPYIRYVVMWQDKKLTAKFLFFISFVCYYTGSEGYSLGVFLCLAFLVRTVLLFSLNYGSKRLEQQNQAVMKKLGESLKQTGDLLTKFTSLPEAETVLFWCDGVSSYLKLRLEKVFCYLKKAETETESMRIVSVHLVGLMVLFALLSVRTLVFSALYTVFVVPAFYARFSDQIDPLATKFLDRAKPHVATALEKAEEYRGICQQKVNEMAGAVQEKITTLKTSADSAEAEKKKN